MMNIFLPKIISSLEEVSFSQLKSKCIARIDTGAYFNVIHCSDIKLYKKSLIFEPLDTKTTFSTKEWKKVKITSSNGIAEFRYVVELETSIGRNGGIATTCLTNRDNMQYQVLIGRKFLAEHNLLVSSR